MVRTFEELGSDSSGYIALLQACGFGLFLCELRFSKSFSII